MALDAIHDGSLPPAPTGMAEAGIVLGGMSTGIALVTPEGRCVYANEALVGLLGYGADELSTISFHQLVHFPDPACPSCGVAHCELEDALEHPGREGREFEAVLCRHAGEPLMALCRTRTTVHEGRPATILEVRDITELRRADLEYRAQEMAYRYAAEAARIGIWSREFCTDSVIVCPVMAALLELPPRRTVLPAARWRALVVNADLPRIDAELEEQMQRGNEFDLEYRVCLDSGRKIWLASRGTVVKDAAGQMVRATGMSVDITERMLVEEALRASEERFRLLAEVSPDGIVVICDGRYVYANGSAARIFGMQRPEDLLGRSPYDFVDERHHALIAARGEQVLVERAMPLLELELHRLDGVRVWVQSTAGRVNWEGREAIQIMVRDVTEQRQTRDKLRVLSERVRLAVEGAGEGVWDWDIPSDSYTVSGGLTRVFGWAEDVATTGTINWERVVYPEDLPRMRAAIQACLDGRAPTYQCEFRLHARDASWRWVLARGVVVARDEAGRPTAMTGTVSDVTLRKESDEIAWRHANLDPLTGLPNRRQFRERLEVELRKAARSGRRMALLFIDLDRFKQVNDWLGHAAGDALLIEAARRLGACVRATDMVARLGGDEFNVLLFDLGEPGHVEFVCEKILDALSRPFELGTDKAYVSGSIGVAIHPDDASAADDLVRKADQAMYAAKEHGKHQFRYFTRSMDEMAHRRLQITNELRHALDDKQLAVHFQPVVRLADGAVVKAEALARWHHPRLGNIEPSVFIPLAEEAGLIARIGDWVFAEADRQSRDWSERFGAAFQIGVNQSPLQFAIGAARQDADDVLAAGGTGGHVAIEITEGALLDASAQVKDKLQRYRDAGIQVAIDDFGTGYSSMAYLQKFAINYLKIDQSFVRDIATNDANRTIAETIILMAHKLGLEVIAEGIESPEQMRCLLQAGCDYGQGFLFSPAVPARDFERILAARPFDRGTTLH